MAEMAVLAQGSHAPRLEVKMSAQLPPLHPHASSILSTSPTLLALVYNISGLDTKTTSANTSATAIETGDMTYSPTLPPEPKPLLSASPSASAPANVTIGHVQLRDLVVCPKRRGVVWYVSNHSIVEHDLLSRNAVPHYIAPNLDFTPVTLAALPLPSTSNEDLVLLAAGGQDAELFLGLYSYMSKQYFVRNPSVSSTLANGNETASGKTSEKKWVWDKRMDGSINNSVLLYFPPAEETEHAGGCAYPRLVVSNNDCSVKFFNVNTESGGFGQPSPSETRAHHRLGGRRDGGVERLKKIGDLKLNVPVNHTSISPDGTTVLSCGDSPSIFLHRIRTTRTGALTFDHIATYSLPAPSAPPTPSSAPTQSPYLPYAFVDGQWALSSHGGGPTSSCFSTCWSADGSKFAVASQEGVVAVWDVRSGWPVACWETACGGKENGKKRPRVSTSVASVSAGGSWTSDRERPPWRSSSSNAAGSRTWMGSSESTTATPSDPYHLIAGGTFPSELYWSDPSAAPSWGVRALKFKKNESGKEVLIFTQHASIVHIVDAERFERHETIRVPHMPRSSSSTAARPVLLQPSGTSTALAEAEYGSAYDYPDTSSYSLPPWSHLVGPFGSVNPRPSVRRRHEIQPGSPLPPLDEAEERDRNLMREFISLTAAGGLGFGSSPPDLASVLDRFETFERARRRREQEQARERVREQERERERERGLARNRAIETYYLGTPLSASYSPPRSSSMRPVAAWPSTSSSETSGPGSMPSMVNPARRSSTSIMTLPGQGASGGGQSRRHSENFASVARQPRGNSGENDDTGLERGGPRYIASSGRIALGSNSNASSNTMADSDAMESGNDRAQPADVVVIPPFRNRRSAEETQQILGMHGINSVIESTGTERTASGSGFPRTGPSTSGQDSHGLDGSNNSPPPSDADAEIDCVPPERGMSTNAATTTNDQQIPTIAMDPPMAETLTLPVIPSPQSASSRSPSPQLSLPMTRSPEPMESRLPPCRELIENTDRMDRLDIAGVTFDESGNYVYVATVDGVTEWKVEGTETVWWGGGSWC